MLSLCRVGGAGWRLQPLGSSLTVVCEERGEKKEVAIGAILPTSQLSRVIGLQKRESDKLTIKN